MLLSVSLSHRIVYLFLFAFVIVVILPRPLTVHRIPIVIITTFHEIDVIIHEMWLILCTNGIWTRHFFVFFIRIAINYADIIVYSVKITTTLTKASIAFIHWIIKPIVLESASKQAHTLIQCRKQKQISIATRSVRQQTVCPQIDICSIFAYTVIARV